VVVLDSRCGARFLDEPRHSLRCFQRIGEQELERDPLLELQVPGGDDDAHTPRAKDSLHAVLARDDVALARNVLSQAPYHGLLRALPSPIVTSVIVLEG